MMSADGRAVLTFPSPYLRNAAAELIIEGSAGGGVRSFKREEVTSYESGFKAELAQFHAAVTGGESPPTDGADGAPRHRRLPGDHAKRDKAWSRRTPVGVLADKGIVSQDCQIRLPVRLRYNRQGSSGAICTFLSGR